MGKLKELDLSEAGPFTGPAGRNPGPTGGTSEITGIGSDIPERRHTAHALTKRKVG